MSGRGTHSSIKILTADFNEASLGCCQLLQSCSFGFGSGAADEREVFEELFERIVPAQIIEQRLDRHPRATKYGGAAQNFKINCDWKLL